MKIKYDLIIGLFFAALIFPGQVIAQPYEENPELDNRVRKLQNCLRDRHFNRLLWH